MRLRRLRPRSLGVQALVLLAATLATGVVALPLGYAISHDRVILLAGSAAGGACLLAGLSVLGLRAVFPGPEHALVFVGLGILFRMGMPFATLLGIHLHGDPLASKVFLYYVIVFYPVMLAFETVLTLPVGPGSDTAPKRQPPS